MYCFIVADQIGIRETLMLQGALVVLLVFELQFFLGRSETVARDRRPQQVPVESSFIDAVPGGGK